VTDDRAVRRQVFRMRDFMGGSFLVSGRFWGRGWKIHADGSFFLATGKDPFDYV
jgi:hypothetical protein